MMEIKIKRNKSGKERASYYCNTMNRIMPMKIAEAKSMIAKGEAEAVANFFFEL